VLSRRSGSGAGTQAPLVDDRWLHALQKSTFKYFWQQSNPENGLIPDNTLVATPASIAGVGLALATYAVGAERRFVTRKEALERTLSTLRLLQTAIRGRGRCDAIEASTITFDVKTAPRVAVRVVDHRYDDSRGGCSHVGGLLRSGHHSRARGAIACRTHLPSCRMALGPERRNIGDARLDA
jgi:hypothetical protein